MTAYLFYTKDSPMERDVTAFSQRLAEFRVDSKLIDADSRDGVALAELYDIVSRPSVVLATDDGTVIQRWQHALPLAEDISYLAHQ